MPRILNMNIEENRLQTFINWPSDAAVSPNRIAKAGFFSLHQNLTVECFCCGLQISEWNYGDQVMTRHRQLMPTCNFVVDPSTSGNVPIISQFNNSSESSIDVADSPVNSLSLTHEAVRLQSFEDWPVSHIVTPESLSRAGFYYLKQRDKTKCAFCDGIVVAWEVGDDPDREHRRHFPNCSFVQNVINPRLESSQEPERGNVHRNSTFTNLNLISSNNIHELGINDHRGPKKIKYATLEARLCSYAAWPDDLIQTPDTLAQAGFYYEGAGDQVRCFHCDGGLRHWDPQDDPWTEHARWFPNCFYVQLVKGRNFVAACAIGSDTTENMEEGIRKSTPRTTVHREISDREIQMHMLTPQVITALNVGLHVGRVKQAIKDKIERTGVGFVTADAVIEATLNLQHDEEETTDTYISDEVARALTNAIEQGLNSRTERSNVADDASASSRPKSSQSIPTDTTNSTEKPKKVLSLEEENRLLKEERLCKICMDVEVGIVFLPCGHLATCVNCAPNLQDCPVCRSAIKATVRTFFS